MVLSRSLLVLKVSTVLCVLDWAKDKLLVATLSSRFRFCYNGTGRRCRE